MNDRYAEVSLYTSSPCTVRYDEVSGWLQWYTDHRRPTPICEHLHSVGVLSVNLPDSAISQGIISYVTIRPFYHHSDGHISGSKLDCLYTKDGRRLGKVLRHRKEIYPVYGYLESPVSTVKLRVSVRYVLPRFGHKKVRLQKREFGVSQFFRGYYSITALLRTSERPDRLICNGATSISNNTGLGYEVRIRGCFALEGWQTLSV